MATHTTAHRRMPTIENEARREIFRQMPRIRETIMNQNERKAIGVGLARAIATADPEAIIGIFKEHPIGGTEIMDASGKVNGIAVELARSLVGFHDKQLIDLIGDKVFTHEERVEYGGRKAAFIRALLADCPGMRTDTPVTLGLAISALNILPDAVVGKTDAGMFSSKACWLGNMVQDPVRPGMITLVLSGGAAKGMFYMGFLRAIRERGFWPDLVVGNSAGGIAAAGLGTGIDQDKLEEAFSARAMRKIFNPFLAPITLVATGGKGVVGLRYGAHLENVFGDARFSECADCFVITTVQRPVDFGKAVIGCASEGNGGLSMSSDIPLYLGAWGTSAMQGIIPQPKVRGFTAERLEQGLFGITTRSMELPFATLDDGGVTEDLPVATAGLILQGKAANSLVIMVNLANLNPDRAVIPHTEEQGGGFFKMLSRRWNEIVEESAFKRAYYGFEHVFNEGIVQSVESIAHKGNVILLNPNCDGSLDSISLLDFKGADAIRDYGYATGRKLTDILMPERP